MSINPRNIFEPETRTRKNIPEIKQTEEIQTLASPAKNKEKEIPAINPEMMLQASRMTVMKERV